jgi:L-malate glycosyltransferase
VIATLQVIASPRMGGAETTFVRHVDALSGAAHPVTAAVRRGSALVTALRGTPRVIEVAMTNYIDLASGFLIRRLARESESSVVQSWMSRATWLTRVPRGCVHLARLGGYYQPRYFRHAHGWITVTDHLRRWMLAQGFPADRVAQVPNYVSDAGSRAPPFSRSDLGIPEDAHVVVAMGRFIDKKGFPDLLRAFLALGARLGGRPLHLLLMGQGPQRALLERMAADAPLRIHFTGWVERAADALALGDVFVCPSLEEAHGNVILEAWGAGRAVISTRCEGPAELIEHRCNGLLCEPGDVATLSILLRKVLQHADLRESLAARGQETQRTRHHRGATLAAYLDFYECMQRRYA